MSNEAKDVVMPRLAITEKDRLKAEDFTLPITGWNQQARAEVICRERQLLHALTQRDEYQRMNDELSRKLVQMEVLAGIEASRAANAERIIQGAPEPFRHAAGWQNWNSNGISIYTADEASAKKVRDAMHAVDTQPLYFAEWKQRYDAMTARVEEAERLYAQVTAELAQMRTYNSEGIDMEGCLREALERMAAIANDWAGVKAYPSYSAQRMLNQVIAVQRARIEKGTAV